MRPFARGFEPVTERCSQPLDAAAEGGR